MMMMFLVTSAFAKVDINKASVQELETLSGIGAAKAEAIVQYREEHGNFKKKEDLVQVKGVGDKIVEKISDDIEVSK
jgi:competence protein ComEA